MTGSIRSIPRSHYGITYATGKLGEQFIQFEEKINRRKEAVIIPSFEISNFDSSILVNYFISKNKEKENFKVVLFDLSKSNGENIRRLYLGEGYKQSYSMTIGADFAVMRIKVDPYDVLVQTWELASQIRFQSVREAYYDKAKSIIIVFDQNQPEQYNKIPDFISENISANKRKDFPILLIGLKNSPNESTRISTPSILTYISELSKFTGSFAVGISTTITDKLLSNVIEYYLVRSLYEAVRTKNIKF